MYFHYKFRRTDIGYVFCNCRPSYMSEVLKLQFFLIFSLFELHFKVYIVPQQTCMLLDSKRLNHLLTNICSFQIMTFFWKQLGLSSSLIIKGNIGMYPSLYLWIFHLSSQNLVCDTELGCIRMVAFPGLLVLPMATTHLLLSCLDYVQRLHSLLKRTGTFGGYKNGRKT